uniref:Reverse transcriptase domain-containing protein n=2 Tax=Schizaphis graminum TaxID=13262 RepID=A0A2S2NZ95_SCHGA
MVWANCMRGGMAEVVVSREISQGSVVDPLLWNVTFNSVLQIAMPSGAKLLGFADDTLIVTYVKSVIELEGVTYPWLKRMRFGRCYRARPIYFQTNVGQLYDYYYYYYIYYIILT